MERRNLSYKDLSEREVSRGSIGSVPASPYSKSFLPGIKDN